MPELPSRSVSFAQFSALARRVAEHARSLGLVAPAFRTPPRLAGADRTLRRTAPSRVDARAAAGMGGVVAVRLAGRAAAAIAGDLVDGVVAVNGLTGDEAAGARRDLLAAALGEAGCRAA